MARKRKSSGADDVMELVAMLPWWVGCILAVVAYALLHRIASQEIIQTTTSGQIGTMVTKTIWRTLATFGQYILPVLCLAGAGVSFYRRRQRQGLIANVAGSQAADVLDGMTWQEFELLVGEAFRLQGYSVVETGGAGPDGGIDLVLRKGNEKFLVQCKQWKAFTVGVTVVRELYGVMAANGAAGGFVVTSGKFTDDAKKFSEGRNLKLLDGQVLTAMIKSATANLTNQAPAAKQPVQVANATPSCPVCSKPMVQRQAKRGNSAGNLFWGCTGYPACKGTRQIA